MKIGIDISQIVYSGTGVSSYTRNLVEHLLQVDKKNSYLLFASSLRRKPEFQNYFRQLSHSGYMYNYKVISFPPTLLDILWNKIHSVPVETFTKDLDIFHCSDWTEPPTKAKKVTTLHDFVTYKYPEASHPSIVATQKRKLDWARKECSGFIAVSEATKKDAREILNLPEEKITVIYEAAGKEYEKFKKENEEFRLKEIARVREKYQLAKDYILAVGTREPRKNLERLISAYQKINREQVDLVIAGKYGWGDESKAVTNTEGVKIVGYVPTSDLPALYAGAEVFAYPSLYEGFGQPVLEAMSVGCPVISSNTSSLPEVGGEAAIYIDPLDVSDLKDKLRWIIDLPSTRRKQLINKGFEQAKKFSWRKTAEETLRTYEGLATL